MLDAPSLPTSDKKQDMMPSIYPQGEINSIPERRINTWLVPLVGLDGDN